jgi:hypothetical protein
MGKAKKNPYLAAERYLQAGGKAVMSSNGVLKLDPSEGTVFAPSSSVRSVAEAERILEWVAEGGHFVCFLERGEDYWRDVGEYPDHREKYWSDEDADVSQRNGLETILEALELELVDLAEDDNRGEDVSDEESSEQEKEERDKQRLLVNKGSVLPHAQKLSIYIDDTTTYDVLLGGMLTISTMDEIPYEGDWYDAVAGEHRFFSRLFGYTEHGNEFMGRVTFVSEARPFRNPYLKYEQHAELLELLASGSGTVVFSLGKVRSFTAMLGEYAPKALWALLVLTVLWLWKNIPRFGPLLDVVDGHSRNYKEHVLQVGRFYWRFKRSDIILKSLRDAVRHKSGHAFSEVADEEALVSQLSQHSGIDRQSVSEAMFLNEVKDTNTMVRITKILQSLLKQL